MNGIDLQDLARDPGALDRVAAGERPVAELRPVAAPRPFGLAAGAFAVPDDFDAPLPDDTLAGFAGR